MAAPSPAPLPSIRAWWSSMSTRSLSSSSPNPNPRESLSFQSTTVPLPSSIDPWNYQAAFYQSPNSDYYYAIQQQGNRLWVEAAKMGFYGTVLQRDCATEQEAINDCVSLCQQHEREGWMLRDDPRRITHSRSSSVTHRWLVLCAPPMTDPSAYASYVVDPLSRWCHVSVFGRVCTFSQQFSPHGLTEWRQWWEHEHDMERDLETWITQQIKQHGFINREYPFPKQGGGRQGTFWLNECACTCTDMTPHQPQQGASSPTTTTTTTTTNTNTNTNLLHASCGSRASCRYLSHGDHGRLYHPPLSHPDYPFIQAHAVSPLLRLAYARYEWIIHQTLSRLPLLKPFVNDIVMAAGIEGTPNKRVYGLSTAEFAPSYPGVAPMRQAWKPVYLTGPSPLPISDRTRVSKCGGVPYLLPSELYPTCPTCSSPLLLLFQLCIHELPVPLCGTYVIGHDHDILQVFVCMGGTTCANTGKHNKDYYYHVRFVAQQQPIATHTQNTSVPSMIPTGVIYDWPERLLSWSPCFDDIPSLQMDPSFPSLHMDDDIYRNEYQHSDDHQPYGQDKIGGFPYYTCKHRQSVMIPTCRVCGCAMRYLLQVSSDGIFSPIDMGNGGKGHVYQCAKHQQQVAFEWLPGRWS